MAKKGIRKMSTNRGDIIMKYLLILFAMLLFFGCNNQNGPTSSIVGIEETDEFTTTIQDTLPNGYEPVRVHAYLITNTIFVVDISIDYLPRSFIYYEGINGWTIANPLKYWDVKNGDRRLQFQTDFPITMVYVNFN